jgi:hypothetical protein
MTYGFDEIILKEEPSGTVVTLVFKDTLKREDYEHFVPQIEKIMESREKINLLIVLRDFSGWTAGALWEDAKFGIRHFDDIERLAIVGDTTWQKAMTGFVKPFTRAEVKYFDFSDLAQAETWVNEPY